MRTRGKRARRATLGNPEVQNAYQFTLGNPEVQNAYQFVHRFRSFGRESYEAA